MCTGFELLMGALGIGSAVAPLMAKGPPDPPPLPALTPAGARAPGATVRIGTGQDEMKNDDPNAPGTRKFSPERSAGKVYTGLGRSGLAL